MFSSSVKIEPVSVSNNRSLGKPVRFMIGFFIAGHSGTVKPALLLDSGVSIIMVTRVAPALRTHNPNPNQQTQSSENLSSSQGDIL